MTILESMQGRGQAAVEAQYLATGRLSTLRTTVSKLFKFFLSVMSKPTEDKGKESNLKALNSTLSSSAREGLEKPAGAYPSSTWRKLSGHGMSIQGLHLIMLLEGGVGRSDGGEEDMKGLFVRYGLPLMESLVPRIVLGATSKSPAVIDSSSSSSSSSSCSSSSRALVEGVEDALAHVCTESRHDSGQVGGDSNGTLSEMEESDYHLLCCLASSPWSLPLLCPEFLHPMIQAVLSSTREALSLSDPSMQEGMLIKYLDLLMAVLTPFCYVLYPVTPAQAKCYPTQLFDSTALVRRLFLPSESLGDDDAEDCGPVLESIKTIVENNGPETANSMYWPGCVASVKAGGADSGKRGLSEIENILRISAVISEHMEGVLELFVDSPVWLRSTAMQVRGCGLQHQNSLPCISLSPPNTLVTWFFDIIMHDFFHFFA